MSDPFPALVSTDEPVQLWRGVTEQFWWAPDIQQGQPSTTIRSKRPFLFYALYLGLICCIHAFPSLYRHSCNPLLFHSESAQTTLRKLSRKLH